MASAEVVTTTTITLTLSANEVDELGDQVTHLIDDNRWTEVTRILLCALNQAGYHE